MSPAKIRNSFDLEKIDDNYYLLFFIKKFRDYCIVESISDDFFCKDTDDIVNIFAILSDMIHEQQYYLHKNYR